MKKTIRLPLTPQATFVNPENPDWMAEISYVYISGADNEQGYDVTYNWESWPDEPGMGTLTDEEVAELIKEHGPHWEEEYSHWIGDKVYVLDSPSYPAIIQGIEAERHGYDWTSYDEDGEEYDEGTFYEEDLGVTVFDDKSSFKDALQKKYEHETEFQKEMIREILAELYN